MKWLSRKLIVFLIGTVLLIFSKIDGNTWLILASVYMGMNAVDKLLERKDK
jgi:hypothetical protein